MFSASRNDWLRHEFFRLFIAKLACDQFAEGDIGQSHARLNEDHRPLAVDKLADPAGDDVDEISLAWKDGECLVEEMSLHIVFSLPTQEADRAGSIQMTLPVSRKSPSSRFQE